LSILRLFSETCFRRKVLFGDSLHIPHHIFQSRTGVAPSSLPDRRKTPRGEVAKHRIASYIAGHPFWSAQMSSPFFKNFGIPDAECDIEPDFHPQFKVPYLYFRSPGNPLVGLDLTGASQLRHMLAHAGETESDISPTPIWRPRLTQSEQNRQRMSCVSPIWHRPCCQRTSSSTSGPRRLSWEMMPNALRLLNSGESSRLYGKGYVVGDACAFSSKRCGLHGHSREANFDLRVWDGKSDGRAASSRPRRYRGDQLKPTSCLLATRGSRRDRLVRFSSIRTNAADSN
jgi:hypothetical protein